MALAEVKNLTFTYPGAERPILTDISFSLPVGCFAVLTGNSGSGKTTLLRLLKRELAPRGEMRGEVLFDGQSLVSLTDRASTSRIGFVAQDPETQIVSDRVYRELAFALESLGVEQRVMSRRVAELAGYFGLEELFRAETDTLSGGQKQLLNLASVLTVEPELLLLDEPVSQLDPVAEASFLSLLQRLNRELGITVLLSAHDPERVFGMADLLLHLEGGKLTYIGTPADFAENLPEPAWDSLPAAARIWKRAGEKTGVCPLTVREGKAFLQGKTLTAPARNIPAFATPVLEAKELCFRFSRTGTPITERLSLTLHAGERLCLLGGNGSGKTTLLRLLCGLLSPLSGRVTLDGKPLRSYGKALREHGIAYLPQDPKILFAERTVRAELERFADGRAVDWRAVALQIGILPILDRDPLDLSGGELQLCALARVLLQSPRVLLLDEPTKGLDVYARRRLCDLLREQAEQGVAILSVTHDVAFAAESADLCALLFDGNVTEPEPTARFFAKNRFYTTPTARMTDGVCITPDEVCIS